MTRSVWFNPFETSACNQHYHLHVEPCQDYISNLAILTLTHWVTHICVSRLTIIGSDNGLSPGRRQAIIWTNAGILLIRPLGTNFNEMWIEILAFSFMKMRLKVSSAKWRPFCFGLNELRPNDAILLNTSRSLMALVRVHCLMAPSHKLNHWWLWISMVRWHLYHGNLREDTSVTNHYVKLAI